jgi:hypothetical protein
MLELDEAALPGVVDSVEPLWRDEFNSWFGEEPTVRRVTDGVVADSSNYHMWIGAQTINGGPFALTLVGTCGPASGAFTIPPAVEQRPS